MLPFFRYTLLQENDSDFLRHIPCPNCSSRDNNAEYSDGHTHCFGCGHHTKGDGPITGHTPRRRTIADLIQGETVSLDKRKITEETCRHFGYRRGDYKGRTVHVAPYYNAEGELVAQKIRFADKTFRWLGDPDEAMPFGSQCWAKAGKKIVVTEGEIDCLSMSQVQGNSWPTVSIACGAGPQIRKYIAQNRDYLNNFDEVVLMFDMDEPGRKAAQLAASVIGPKARIAELPHPYKDANEMLVEGAVKELINAMWKAQPYRPEGVVEMTTLEEEVLAVQPRGLSSPFPSLDKVTYGTRRGELLTLGAGTGIGKTTALVQWLHHLAKVHKQNVAGFFLEQGVKETARRLVGVEAKKPLHVPDGGWTDEDITAAFDRMRDAGKVFLYDSFGNNTWDSIREKMEYLAHAEDCHYFVLDHLTALATWQDDERTALDKIMSELGGMVQKLQITVLLVSHLNTPDGTPHEEGGRVTIRQFRGSRSIGYWSHGMFGLERNQQAEDLTERHTTTFRVLKDRFTGKATGETFPIYYQHETGLLTEDIPARAAGFQDETGAVAGETGI